VKTDSLSKTQLIVRTNVILAIKFFNYLPL